MFKIHCYFGIFPLHLQSLHRMRSHQSFLTSVAWSQEQGCAEEALSDHQKGVSLCGVW